jgi:hypothetical protein
MMNKLDPFNDANVNPTSPIGAFSDDTMQGNQRLDREGLHYREVCAGSVAAAIFGGGWDGKASFMRSRSSRSSGSGSV